MEVDTAFFADPDGAKADLVDVHLGAFSEFPNEFGYYPQGVSVSTGQGRPVPGTARLHPGEARSLDDKDVDFAVALVVAGLISLDTLAERAAALPAHPAVIDRIQNWVDAMRSRYQQ